MGMYHNLEFNLIQAEGAPVQIHSGVSVSISDPDPACKVCVACLLVVLGYPGSACQDKLKSRIKKIWLTRKGAL